MNRPATAPGPRVRLALPECARPRRRILGSLETVREKLEAVVEEYHADEVMVVTITHDHAARCASYEQVAALLR
jgi:alkanesulfonate monooxygenase SsuD/methylene tetrahydromethanopterin reductase-like flavin-dependent oxidoreductase (luciferase family)